MKKIGSVVFMLVAGGVLVLAAWYGGRGTSEAPLPAPAVAPPETASSAVRLLAFGDSLTAGYGLTRNEAYPALLEQKLLARGYTVTVMNSGVSGETSAGGVRRAEFIRRTGADIVLLGLGANDALRLLPPTETRKNIETILTILRAGEAPPAVVLLGMRAPSNADASYRRAFDRIYPDMADQFGVSLVPFFLAGVALDPAFTQDDGIHPNRQGYEKIVDLNILPVVDPLVRDLSMRSSGP